MHAWWPAPLARHDVALERTDASLRARLLEVVTTVPLAFGHFWLAALASLDPAVDVATPLPPPRPIT